MNLGKYIRNAAITTAATAAILAFACGHGADAQKQAANNSVHRPYVQNHINPEIPATYVFNEIAGNCKLTPIYFEPRFFDFDYSVGNNYDSRVAVVEFDLYRPESAQRKKLPCRKVGKFFGGLFK